MIGIALGEWTLSHENKDILNVVRNRVSSFSIQHMCRGERKGDSRGLGKQGIN